MIGGIHEDIVNIQVIAAIRLFEYRVQKIDLTHVTLRHGIGRDILHADGPLQDILDAPDTICDVVDGLLGKGYGHQVIELSRIGTIRKMFAVDEGIVIVEKPLHLDQEILVQGEGSANTQRQPMAYQRVAFDDPVEFLFMTSTHPDPVLRSDLDKTDLCRPLFKDLWNDLLLQAQSRALYRVSKGGMTHSKYPCC